MARWRSFLTLLSGIGAGWLVAVSSAQLPQPERSPGEQPKPTAPAGQPDGPRRFFHHGGPEADAMRERAMHELQKLSPERRAELWKAVWTVINLPPEKRQMLLGMDEERRKFAREEIERAIGENGLQLDEEKRKKFVQRYFEERRAIEERLRKEADEKRRQLLGEMRGRLKQEFGAIAPKSAAGDSTTK